MSETLARLLAAQRLRLPPGRCACHEPTVKWCTRHGKPQKNQQIQSRLPRAA